MDEKQKYRFSWGLIGDIEIGRPNLGNSTRVEVYRLMQFTLRDTIEQKLGTIESDKIFYNSGKIAGKEFYKNMVEPTNDLDDFLNQIKQLLIVLGIGILRVENIDMENGNLTFTISEDLDCSGLPELKYEICTYDEGFISGLLESFSGIKFKVKEVDCWCTGERTCRFNANIV